MKSNAEIKNEENDAQVGNEVANWVFGAQKDDKKQD